MSELKVGAADRAYERRIESLKLFSWLAGAGVIIMGSAVLAGWALNSSILKSVVPGLTAMNPLTAISFILSGLALLAQMLSESFGGNLVRIICRTAIFVLLSIVLIKMASFAGLDYGLDRLLFHEKLEAYSPPNRMAPNTAVIFLCVGIALTALKSKTRTGILARDIFALAGFAIAAFVMLGYMYGVERFYRVTHYIPMALNTASAFLFISTGILCAPSKSAMMKLIIGEGAGSRMLRSLLPLVIFIPMLMEWSRGRLASNLSYYGIECGASLFAVMNIIILSAVVLVNARSMNRADDERRALEEVIERSHDEMEAHVLDRTKALAASNKELQNEIARRRLMESEMKEKVLDLERFSRLTVDREIKMEELENTIRELRQRLGEAKE